MTDQKMVSIQYIGSKRTKSDNINDTGITWDCPGAVREYPALLKFKLLAHPDIWREVDPNQVQSERDETKDFVGYVVEQIPTMPKMALQAIRAAIDNEIRLIDLRAAQPKEPPPAPAVEPPALTPEVIAESSDVPTMKAAVARQEKLLAVIRNLDKESDEDYTAQGKPRRAVVAQRSGIADVTSEEIAGIVAAMKE